VPEQNVTKQKIPSREEGAVLHVNDPAFAVAPCSPQENACVAFTVAFFIALRQDQRRTPLNRRTPPNASRKKICFLYHARPSSAYFRLPRSEYSPALPVRRLKAG